MTSANLLIVILVGAVVGALVGLALGGALTGFYLAVVAGFLATVIAGVARNEIMKRAGAGPDDSKIPNLVLIYSAVASLGGSFHSVVGEDVPAAVVDFATGANATMIVVGVSRHGRLRRLFAGTTGDRIASLAGAVDFHLVTHSEVARASGRRRALFSPLSRSRQVAGWLAAVLLPAVLRRSN